jgi:hypothetical protein
LLSIEESSLTGGGFKIPVESVMNAIVKQFGFENWFLLHKARSVVMHEATFCIRQHRIDEQEQIGQQLQRKECIVVKALTMLVDPYDDDFQSDTDDDDCSMEDETSCSSSSVIDDSNSSICNRVSFCTPLVTATYVRPTTTMQEKYALFYTDMDYREFRRNFIVMNRIHSGQVQNQSFHHHRHTVVQIHPNVVTAVYTIPTVEDPSDLFYTKADLQG